jgi:hypothetical protein
MGSGSLFLILVILPIFASAGPSLDNSTTSTVLIIVVVYVQFILTLLLSLTLPALFIGLLMKRGSSRREAKDPPKAPGGPR